MKRVVKVALILMTILTVIYAAAVVHANANSNSNDDHYIHPYLTSEYVGIPPTEWYTPEELGIVRTFWYGNCLEIWVDERKEPFQLEEEKPIFLYEGKFYQVVTEGHRYVLYAAVKYEGDTAPTEWYTPEQIGIYDVIEYVENASWLHIAVDREKEPFPLQEKQPVFLYKDKFYQVSPYWATPALPESANLWQVPIGGALGAGWAFTGALFVKMEKKRPIKLSFP